MANYANLIASVQQAIKQNGNEEITGTLLQQSLVAMINALGVGYQFVGVATPTTSPGTPDQRVFYIASQPGTYVNFGGLSVSDGEVAILKYNGSWTKDTTGATSFEKAKQYVDGRFDKAVHQVGDPLQYDAFSGYFYNSSGVYTQSNYYSGRKYAVVPGQDYAFSGRVGSTSSIYLINWLDENGNFLRHDDRYKGNGSTTVQFNDEIITVPDDAAYLYLNTQNSINARYYELNDLSYVPLQKVYDDSVKYDDVIDNLESTDTDKPLSANQGRVLNDKTNAESYTEVEHEEMDGYFDSDGVVHDSSNSYMLWAMQVTAGNEYAFSTKRDATANQYVLAWYSDDTFGTCVKREDFRPVYGTETTYTKQRVVAPEGATYALLNIQKKHSSVSDFYAVGSITLQEVYDELMKLVGVDKPELPEYYDEYLSERVSSIINRLFEIQAGDVFGFITDTHPSNRYNVYSGRIYRELMSKTPIKKVVFGGDIGPNNATNYGGSTTAKEALVKSLIQQTERLYAPIQEIGKIYKMRGNHDFSVRMYEDSNPDNTGWQATNGATRGLIVNELPGGIVSDPNNPDACYYYFDNTIEKIRYIVVDTSDSVNAHYEGLSNVVIWVSDAQAKWFAEQAMLTTPAGYNIVVFAHCPLAKVACYGTYWNKASVIRLKNIMFAANAKSEITVNKTDSGASGTVGTYDFSSFTAKVLAVISGHVHCDEQTYERGILFYTSAADYATQDQLKAGVENAFNAPIQNKVRNTVTEDLLNVITLDTHANILDVFRVGAGYDRKFNLQKISVSVGSTVTLESSLSGSIQWYSYDAEGRSSTTRPMVYEHTITSVNGSGVVTGLSAGESVVVAYSEDDKTFEFFDIICE